nr:MAG TPA: hypothetical protein [Caudoviricetes sp.]
MCAKSLRASLPHAKISACAKKSIVQASASRNVNDICAGLCRAVDVDYAAADIRIGVHVGLVGRADRIVVVPAISRAALVGSQ